MGEDKYAEIITLRVCGEQKETRPRRFIPQGGADQDFSIHKSHFHPSTRRLVILIKMLPFFVFGVSVKIGDEKQSFELSKGDGDGLLPISRFRRVDVESRFGREEVFGKPVNDPVVGEPGDYFYKIVFSRKRIFRYGHFYFLFLEEVFFSILLTVVTGVK